MATIDLNSLFLVFSTVNRKSLFRKIVEDWIRTPVFSYWKWHLIKMHEQIFNGLFRLNYSQKIIYNYVQVISTVSP